MKRLLILSMLVIGFAVLTPGVQAQESGTAAAESIDDTYPPVIPGYTTLPVTEIWLHQVAQGTDNTRCHGRIVLRGTCEIHYDDASLVYLSGRAEPTPTGNGAEVGWWMEFRVYDLDQGGELVHTCRRERTYDNMQTALVDTAVSNTISGSLCGHYSVTPWWEPGPTVNLRFEIEANSTGWVSLEGH